MVVVKKTYGKRHPNRLHYERYDGEPLSTQYKQQYWGALENVTNYPLLKRRGN